MSVRGCDSAPTWGREVSTSSPSVTRRMSAAARWERLASAALMGPVACPPHGVRGACCPMSPSTDLDSMTLFQLMSANLRLESSWRQAQKGPITCALQIVRGTCIRSDSAHIIFSSGPAASHALLSFDLPITSCLGDLGNGKV